MTDTIDNRVCEVCAQVTQNELICESCGKPITGDKWTGYRFLLQSDDDVVLLAEAGGMAIIVKLFVFPAGPSVWHIGVGWSDSYRGKLEDALRFAFEKIEQYGAEVKYADVPLIYAV